MHVLWTIDVTTSWRPLGQVSEMQYLERSMGTQLIGNFLTKLILAYGKELESPLHQYSMIQKNPSKKKINMGSGSWSKLRLRL